MEFDDVQKLARQRVSRRGAIALLSMLAPATLFPLELLLMQNDPRFEWAIHPLRWPFQLWILAAFGTVATCGGVLDWVFHRSGCTAVGKPEHHSHIAALAGGGIPLFFLMSIASTLSRPQLLLLPILLVFGYTIVLICYDEFVFHRRRCGHYETLTHRLLTFGNGAAWLAWMHWIYVRPF